MLDQDDKKWIAAEFENQLETWADTIIKETQEYLRIVTEDRVEKAIIAHTDRLKDWLEQDFDTSALTNIQEKSLYFIEDGVRDLLEDIAIKRRIHNVGTGGIQ